MDRPLWAFLISTTLLAIGVMRIGTGIVLYLRQGTPDYIVVHAIQALIAFLAGGLLWWYSGRRSWDS